MHILILQLSSLIDCTKPGLKFGKIVIEGDNVMRMNTKAKLKFM